MAQANSNNNGGGSSSNSGNQTPPDNTNENPAATSDEDTTPTTQAAQSDPKGAQANAKVAENRAKEIDGHSDLEDDEKEVLKLYDKGVHMFQIAKQVYKFANSDTVGRVMLIVRKEHANDDLQVADVNATKGYTGVGVGA